MGKRQSGLNGQPEGTQDREKRQFGLNGQQKAHGGNSERHKQREGQNQRSRRRLRNPQPTILNNNAANPNNHQQMPARPPKQEREYAKARAADIRAHTNYVEHEAYPTNTFQFVAWFDARFGFRSNPEPAEVEAEIRCRNPLFFEGKVLLPDDHKTEPTHGLPGERKVEGNDQQGRSLRQRIEQPEGQRSLKARIDNPKESTEEEETADGTSLPERIHGTISSRTRQQETQGHTLAERIGGPIQARTTERRGQSLSERISGTIAERTKDGTSNRVNSRGGIKKTTHTGRKARTNRD